MVMDMLALEGLQKPPTKELPQLYKSVEHYLQCWL